MRFAFCVEDRTDQEIFAVILKRILGAPIEPYDTQYQFQSGGFGSALRLAKKVARRAAQDALDGALFAIDNDGRPIHDDDRCGLAPCRVCQLRRAAHTAEPLSWRREGTPSLRYLFAVPVQTLETWLLLVREQPPFSGKPELVGVDRNGRKQLKRWLYNQESPTRSQRLSIALPLAERLVPQDLASKSQSFAQFFNQL